MSDQVSYLKMQLAQKQTRIEELERLLRESLIRHHQDLREQRDLVGKAAGMIERATAVLKD